MFNKFDESIKLFCAAMLLILSLAAGCGSFPTIPRGHFNNHGRAVDISSNSTRYKRGMAAVVGKNRVVTAFHIIEGNTEYWIQPFSVLEFRASLHKLCISQPESIVVLDLPSNDMFKGWSHQDIFDIDMDGDAPMKTITGRGCFFWKNYDPKPGDSGSPVIDKDGELVGVVYGWQTMIDGTHLPLLIRITEDCLPEK